MRAARSRKYQYRCGTKFRIAPLEKNLLLSALKVWEAKQGIGQSNITNSHGVSFGYCGKRKVAA